LSFLPLHLIFQLRGGAWLRFTGRDELYLGFEQWRNEGFLSNFESELASEQLSCLRSLHQNFSYRCATNAGPTAPFADSTEWKIVRYLSIKALQAFGWVKLIPQTPCLF